MSDYLVDPGAFIGIVSGLGAALLGAYLLVLPRTASTLAFAAFAVLWGLQSAAANAANAAAAVPLAAAWSHVNVALIIPLHLPLLYFVTWFPDRSPRPWAAVWAMPAIGLLVAFAVRPSLFVAGFATSGGYPMLLPGPLFVPVVLGNVVVAFAVALFILALRLRVARAGSARSQISIAAAAILCITMYKAADALAYAVPWTSRFVASMPSYQLVLVWTSAAGTLAAAAWIQAMARRRPWRRLTMVAIWLPFSIGLLEWYTLPRWPAWHTVGLWRLATVALFAYAVARHHLFDLDFRLHRAAPLMVYGFACGILAVSGWGIFQNAFSARPMLGIAATLGVIGVLYPLVRPLRRLLVRVGPSVGDPDNLRRRRVEVYASAVARCRTPRQVRRLAALRERLEIDARDHAIIAGLTRLRGDLPAAPAGRPPAEATAADAQPELVAGRYRVVGAVGEGAQGRLELALDVDTGEKVVVKRMRADAGGHDSHLALEARWLAAVGHPHLVHLMAVTRDEAGPVLVLEHLPGGDLMARLAEGPMAPRRALAVMQGVLSALGALHAHGIVHGDVKPANIVFDAYGDARLADLGSARLAGGAPGPASRAYASPERLQGGRVDGRADLYAAAVTLHEMLTGGLPGETQMELPVEVRPVLERAMAARPAQRYQTAEAFSRALYRALGNRGSGARFGKGFGRISLAAKEDPNPG